MRLCLPVVALVSFVAFLSSSAIVSAQSTGKTVPACSAAITNQSCTLTIDRDAPSSPLPIRMARKATLTLTVTKRPLDSILIDVTTADVALPDASTAIFSAFLPTLGKLEFDVSKVNPLRSGVRPLTRADVLEAAPDSVRTPYIDLLARVSAVNDQQAIARKQLATVKETVDHAGAALHEFQHRSITSWQPGKLPSLPTAKAHLVKVGNAAASALHPGGLIAVLRVTLEHISDALATLPPPSPGLPQQQHALLLEKINEVGTQQVQLEASVQSIQSAQTALAQAAAVVDRVKVEPLLAALSFTRTFTQDVRDVGRSMTVKMTAQDAISKTSTALATATLIWVDTRWEASGGAVFSWLERRAFQNAPIIESGEPQLDPAGRVRTVVTETVTRPTVVPFAFAHYRLTEHAVAGRRLALLVTGGLGINTSSGSADLAVGGSVAYRGIVVGLLRHYGRDLRLLNGVELGDELGSTPPAIPTERVWQPKAAIGVSVRIPF